MATTPHDTLGKYRQDAENLLKQTEAVTRMPESSFAGVAYLGYDAPAALMSRGWESVLTTGAADTGAARLVPFIEGLEHARRVGGLADSHLTLIDHSYGTTTSGIAATRIHWNTIDDLVLMASPGAGAPTTEDYAIPHGHAYAVGVDSNDIVQGIGTDHNFGPNPLHMPGFTHLSNDAPHPESGWWDLTGRHGTEVYMAPGSGSLEDIATVVGGIR